MSDVTVRAVLDDDGYPVWRVVSGLPTRTEAEAGTQVTFPIPRLSVGGGSVTGPTKGETG